MPDLRDTRQKLKIAIAGLALLDVVVILVLFSPLVGSARSRDQKLEQMGTEIQLKTRQVEPLRDVDKKIIAAHQQIDDFYKKRLPGQDSAIAAELGKLAGQSGVKIGQIRYSFKDDDREKDTTPADLQPVKIQADFSGDYLQLVRFVNSVERDPLFFIIDSVDLGGEQAGVVKLQLKLETYLKSGA
jgi:type IV pilus assembly protein PilO